MKDLVLNKFIIHGALISLSWFWYHRMVYTYHFLPRKNIESNVHETNTQGSVFIQNKQQQQQKKLLSAL